MLILNTASGNAKFKQEELVKDFQVSPDLIKESASVLERDALPFCFQVNDNGLMGLSFCLRSCGSAEDLSAANTSTVQNNFSLNSPPNKIVPV